MGTALGPQYNGALHALVAIVRNEGIAGLYRGIWANLCEWLRPERSPGHTNLDLALFFSESRAEHRHFVFHLRVCERKVSGCALMDIYNIFLPM